MLWGRSFACLRHQIADIHNSFISHKIEKELVEEKHVNCTSDHKL
jgi:hypothetical protein